MNSKIKIVIILIFLNVSGSALAQIESDSLILNKKVIIGTKETAPFTIKNGDGTWSGISIDLWEEIAKEFNFSYEIRESDGLKKLIATVEDSSIDMAVAALSITPDREKIFDFTHPFYITGLSIAIPYKDSRNWLRLITSFFSRDFLKVIGFLSLILLAFGLLVWLFERKQNSEQFGGSILKGIGAGFWWSAVTMTTVGYGDKAPQTFFGRLIALVWMFAALIIISSFTAAITTALTMTQLEYAIEGVEDLTKVRVGTVDGSTSAEYLKDRRISYQTYKTPLEGLKAVQNGQIGAMVYDAPILRYLANTELNGTVRVLPNTFQEQYYGFAMPHDSPLREPINRVLLDKIHQPEWQDVLYKYFGN